MLNVVVLIGRLTADPELRYTVNGTAVCNFRLAVDRPFTNREGQQETDFIDTVCWRNTAENVAKYMEKGLMVAVHGRMQIRQWETPDGERRRKAEVVADQVRFLEWPEDRGRSSSSDQPASGAETTDDFEDLFDDDITKDVPF